VYLSKLFRARILNLLKGQSHEIFCFWFFSWVSFPQPQSIPLGLFRIFSKIRRYIRKSRCTTSINDTSGNIAAGINDTGGKFAPVSMIPAPNFATSFASLKIDTGGKMWNQYQAGDSLKCT
jgi:hypothetical protein